MTPVYQEDPELFRQAIESWLANDLDEIICVIDHTDVRSIQIARTYPVQIIITDVPGKRDALRKGWEAASSPIVALVDSDTLWARDTKEQILKPFADPQIGGVGTRQNVYNPENTWQNINDMYLDYRYFDEIASQTRVGRAVSCLSGRTAVYRRELLLEISEDFMGERFLGVPCNSGEDKRLTSLVLERGHRTYMQRNARVWSTFPPDPSTFFKQRLRWSRNTWRSDLRALKRRWIFRHKFLAFTTIDKAIASFTLMIAPGYMIWALAHQAWTLVGALVVWWIVSRAAKHLPHLHRKPLHFFLIPMFVLVSFAVAIVKIYALLTVRKQRWLTRQVEVIDGEIVRTIADEEEHATTDQEQPAEELVLAGATAGLVGASANQTNATQARSNRGTSVPPPGPDHPAAITAQLAGTAKQGTTDPDRSSPGAHDVVQRRSSNGAHDVENGRSSNGAHDALNGRTEEGPPSGTGPQERTAVAPPPRPKDIGPSIDPTETQIVDINTLLAALPTKEELQNRRRPPEEGDFPRRPQTPRRPQNKGGDQR